MDRIIVRVSPDLRSTLDTFSARLSAETEYVYPRTAVVRGLLALAVLAVTDAPHLAPFFVGARMKRGRKRGERRAPPISTSNTRSSAALASSEPADPELNGLGP